MTLSRREFLALIEGRRSGPARFDGLEVLKPRPCSVEDFAQNIQICWPSQGRYRTY